MMTKKIFSAVLFQIQIYFSAGLILYSEGDLTSKSFTLVCDLQGATLTNPVLFRYDGNSAGGCSSPPSPTCNSPIGTITTDASRTMNITLSQTHILDKGNALWSCSHGSITADYNASVNTYCLNKRVESKDKKIEISCNCGFPSVQAVIEYKVGETILGKQTVNLTSSMASCSPDSRAMDFSSKIVDFPLKTLDVCATITTSKEVTDPICSAIDCGFSIGGFSICLIELAAFIIIMILMILKKIGGFSTIKVCVSVCLLIVALIIGLVLGFIVTECKQRDLSLGLGLGLGFALAAAHIITIIVIHKKCDTKKDDGERKGTSTSNIEVTTKKASHVHLGTINGNKVDSQPKESLRPLPVPPTTHPKQLQPISMPNDGATSSEKKKKKRKKKKKSEVREELEDQLE
uniref:Uncharacterized protein LOC111126069 n=1 Tax=Crassostrea virginica TaxID=6565 RepID=A0A8B8DEP5_CRAVI|nr:uncharacterized protein LOC111126069 [Crassostrea virginica]